MGDRLVVVGQGYVGLPLAVQAARSGLQVVGYDVDVARVAAIEAGRSPVEDVPSETLQALLDSGAYRATASADDLGPFDVAVISVPTPLNDGTPDLTYIETAAATLAPLLTAGCTVVLESTTWPGTTEELVAPILYAGSGLEPERDFHLGYSPERIDPGNPVWTFANTPKIVSGVGPRSLEAVEAFFSRIVEKTVPVPSTKVAELAKLIENTFRHVNIALVNELAIYAHDMDIDIWATLDAANTKPFGFMRFTPGPGVGGHCLPVDPSYLSWRVKQSLGHPFRFVELANDINEHMPEYVARRLTLGLNERSLPVKGRRILVLGLSYKRNTGDARESPSRPLCQTLLALGAHVRGVDPYVADLYLPEGVERAHLTAEELRAADAVLLLVDHDDFDRELIVENARYVLDCRRLLPAGPTVEHL